MVPQRTKSPFRHTKNSTDHKWSIYRHSAGFATRRSQHAHSRALNRTGAGRLSKDGDGFKTGDCLARTWVDSEAAKGARWLRLVAQGQNGGIFSFSVRWIFGVVGTEFWAVEPLKSTSIVFKSPLSGGPRADRGNFFPAGALCLVSMRNAGKWS